MPVDRLAEVLSVLPAPMRDPVLFAMPPGQPDLASLYPESPTHFASLTGVALDFAVVADGRATGFTGTLSGTRIAD